ncbi:MAG: UvrD-helicase domain-containing protein [Phycisphaerales bacterium]|jgi:ATP-dependent exoDNAse (exonuclease V) beta subunit|nr:UvrD-helicase domain-containing protein [Phycisphaerales bacterium]
MSAAPSHEIVIASAGTGKTHALSSRLLMLLDRGFPADSILAATFTRKAAGEILERLLARAANSVSSVTARAGLSHELRHDGASIDEDDARRLAATVARSIDALSVGTLDSVLMRLAGGVSLDLGLPPGWTLLDESQALEVRREAVSRVLDGAAGEVDSSMVLEVARAVVRGPGDRGILRALRGAIRPEAAREAPERAAWCGLVSDDAPTAFDASVLDGFQVPLTKAGEPNKNWLNRLEFLRESVQQDDADGVLENGLITALQKGEYSKVLLTDAHQRALRAVAEPARARVLARIESHNLAARALSLACAAEEDRLIRERGGVRFEDLPRLVRGAGSQSEEVYYRLDARSRHVLLDEFQDTSREQLAALGSTLDEVASQGADHSILVVGDPKQSLYMWRGAEPGLLESLSTRWSHVATRTLATSWRSPRGVLHAVNRVFEGLLDNPWMSPASDVAREWAGAYTTHESSPRVQGKHGVARLVVGPSCSSGARSTDSDEDENGGDDHPWAAFVAGRVAEALTHAHDAEVGVLARTNSGVGPIVRALRELHGIHASEEGAATLTSSPPVAAAISMLWFAEHPGDTRAMFHAACGPLGDAAGMRRVLEEPRLTSMDRDALAATLRKDMAREGFSGFFVRLGSRALTAMDREGAACYARFLDLVRAFEARGGPAMAGALWEYVVRARVESPTGSRVRVMTVHQAKGLDFDVVILAELTKRWSPRQGEVVLVRDEATGPVKIAGLLPSKEARTLHERLEELHSFAARRAVREELCVLYVGMTRARWLLEMLVPCDAVPRGASDSITAARVLVGGLAPERGDDLRHAEPNTVIWETPPEEADGIEWWREVHKTEEVAPARAEKVELRITLARGEERSLKRRAMASPSGEKASRVALRDVLRPRATGALDRGTLVHAVMELVEWLGDDEASDAWIADRVRAERARLGTASRDAQGEDAVVETLARALRGEAGGALSRERYANDLARSGPNASLDLRTEWAFACRDEGEQGPRLLSGQIDRLVLIRGADGRALGAEVLDFKTDVARGEADAFAAELGERYAPQMAAYRRAVARSFGLGADRVRAVLVWIEGDRVIDLP